MKKLIKSKKNRGMTYVELIVVLGIFAVLSSVSIFNYGAFQDKVDIKSMANDIALKFVEAQRSSLNGVLPNVTYLDTWTPGYGVYFNLTTDPTALDADDIAFNKKFVYFVDLDNNYEYFGTTPNCTVMECLDKIIITKNNFIANIEKCDDADCNTLPKQSITSIATAFMRPDSGAHFTSNPPYDFSGSSYVKITIESPKGLQAFIKLYPSGRVQID
ncbi:MAG: type II secretion system protein [Candidatus Paceibacterota bacterium]